MKMAGKTEKRERGWLGRAGAMAALAVSAVFGSACGAASEAMQLREQEILVEPIGDYYVGRRYFVRGTRFWGYLRRPRESWEESQLVVFNERAKKQPDRVPEAPLEGPAHGYDQNYEYRIMGGFSGDDIYDPNSNFILPEFVLQDWKLIDEDPGFLFHPDEVYDERRLPYRQ